MLRDEIEEILENCFIDIQQIDWTVDNAMSFKDNLLGQATEAILELEKKTKLKIEVNELGLLQIIQDEIMTDFSLGTLSKKIAGLSGKISARINEWAKIIREEQKE